jgi:hypothetical protein
MTSPAKPASPYIVGPPVPPDHFYGRADQIEKFFRIMRSPVLQPLRVLGLRRSGKTSFLWKVSQRSVYEAELDSASRSTIIAYVTLQDNITSPEKFFLAVAKSIQEARQLRKMESNLPAESERVLRRTLANVRMNLQIIQERKTEYVFGTDVPLQLIKQEMEHLDNIKELERQLEIYQNKRVAPEALPSDFDAFKKWMRSVLIADNKMQVVVLLDEFDVLTESLAFDQSFFGNLRALASGPALDWRFTWVVCSYTDLQLLNQKIDDSDKTSPLFNIFYPHPIILGGMKPVEVEQLIRIPAQKLSVNFSAAEVEAIGQLSGAVPYFVQATADQWWQITQRQVTYSASMSLDDCRQEVLTRLMDTSGQLSAQMESYWRHLTNEEREYLGLVARTEPITSVNSAPEQKLLRFGLLCEKDGQIQISGEVFRQWLRNNLGRLTTQPLRTDSSPPVGISQSGGVTIQAGTVNITGDVTGRDKIETK